eukprot:SAG31_NODE_3425_length_4290_cov_171.943927_1_plen_291_part_10
MFYSYITMADPGTAPRSINYADTLPLAVSSTQNRRSYFPQNGQKFSDTTNNIIRIDVNADGLLDVAQSYLEFTFKDTGIAAGSSDVRTLDQGHPWIKRVTLESAGVILEDINNYNRLVGGILQPAQGSAAYIGEMQLSQGANSNALLNDSAAPTQSFEGFMNQLASVTFKDGASGQNTAQTATLATGCIPKGGTFTGQYHLVCGMLNMDKYLPLFLMGQGFTIQIELANGVEVGCSASGAGTSYDIENVRYVAHIVEMQRDFYDMVRNMQMQSGGSLMIGSSTFRHFTHSY